MCNMNRPQELKGQSIAQQAGDRFSFAFDLTRVILGTLLIGTISEALGIEVEILEELDLIRLSIRREGKVRLIDYALRLTPSTYCDEIIRHSVEEESLRTEGRMACLSSRLQTSETCPVLEPWDTITSTSH